MGQKKKITTKIILCRLIKQNDIEIFYLINQKKKLKNINESSFSYLNQNKSNNETEIHHDSKFDNDNIRSDKKIRTSCFVK